MNEFILSLFYKNDKLKRQTLYLILTGKRTTSTFYYAKMHGLLNVFGLFPHLEKEAFLKVINQLIQQNFLILQDEILYKNHKTTTSLIEYYTVCQHLDGFRFSRNGYQLWRLFQAFVQRLAAWPNELSQIPVEVSPFYISWLNQTIHQMTYQDKQQFINDCQHIFECLPEQTSLFLVQSLSGEHYQGKAFYQLYPQKFQNYPFNECYHLAMIHQFWYQVLKHPKSFIYELFYTQLQHNYNQSMLWSRHLFLQGYTLEQVAELRQLKLSTLNDHLIEWALLDSNFPFERFDLIDDLAIINQSFQEFKAIYGQLDFIIYRLSQIKLLNRLNKNQKNEKETQ